MAGNTSHKTPCRPGNATHDDRASNPTVCQLSDPVPWQQNKATWRWTKDTKRAVTGDEAVDMLSLLLSSDRGNTSSASDGRSALASASGPPRFSTARRTPDHWHVDECCQVCTGTGCLRGLICPGTIGFQARETVEPGRFGRHRCLEREPARAQSPFDHPHEFAFYCLCPLAGTGGYPMWFAFKKALSR